MSNSIYSYVNPVSTGMRLDHFLAHMYPQYSRSQLAQAVSKGLVTVGGGVRKNSYKLKEGELVEGSILFDSVPELKAEKIEFPIIFEDEHLLVISKPPDLVVHPGSGNINGTLASGLLYHCQAIADVGNSQRPGIVHRLDKDTSGLMVVAKNDVAHRKLSSSFKERNIHKQYHAIVCGIPKKSSGRIVASIGRHPIHRQKMSVREIGGRYAVSSWKVKETLAERYCLVEVEIETGRTHQIRVHMAHIGHPVTGDHLYGKGAKEIFPRQMLHSYKMKFHHPITNDIMNFSAPYWPDFEGILQKLRLG